jgi:hypothetical protein
MSSLHGTVNREGILVGRVAADWVAPNGSELELVEPEIADAMPQPDLYWSQPYVPPVEPPVEEIQAEPVQQEAALEEQ